MTTPAVTLELETPSEGPWPVLAVVGEEAMSDLFSFRIALRVSTLDEPNASSHAFAQNLIGRFAKLTLAFDPESEGERAVAQLRYGLVSHARYLGVFGQDAAAYARIDCTLVPRAHRLTLRRNTRIFQDCCVYEVISTIFAEHGLVHWWSLAGSRYPRRQYCTQYDETDWAFVTRLLAEEGLASFFMHVPKGTPPDECGHVIDGGDSHDPPRPRTAADYANIVGTVAEGIGAAAGAVSGLIGGTASAVGAGIGLAGSSLRGPEGDPDAIEFGVGGNRSAGPANQHGDVFCFVDTASGLAKQYPNGTNPENQPATLDLVQREGTNLKPSALEVLDLVPVHRMVVKKVTQRDHDFRRPLLELSVTAPATPDTLELYESQSDFDPPYVATAQAQARLEQLQADAFVVRARSLCPRVLPGHVFSIHAGGPATRHAAVSVRHRWIEPQALESPDRANSFDEYLRWQGERTRFGEPRGPLTSTAATGAVGYQNELEMVASTTLYRPEVPRTSPRATSDTAVVTGPAGVEIHTDKLGRVKVQFHWDREGTFDELTSCWLRVVHPWVGAGFGFQFVPRVGTEVLVTYVGGDPDRPVVTGALYDGTHPFPEPLPERATRSAIRTQSSPGGGGFHEIVFEDASGDERLTIRSQSRLEEEAKGAHDLTVGDDQRILVGGDQRTNVTGDRSLGVGGKLVTQSGEDRTLTVGGSSTLRVDANRTASIQGNSLRDVSGLSLQVTGEHDVTVVGGDRSVTVKGNAVTYVGGGTEATHATTFVEGNAYLNAANAFLNATANVTIQGLTASGDHASKITLSVGTSSIVIEHDKITIAAENVVVAASSALTATSQHVKLVGSDSTLVAGDDHHLRLDSHGGEVLASPAIMKNADGTTVKLDGSDAKFTASGEAKTEAGSIKLNSGSGSGSSSSGNTSSSSTPPPPSTTPNVKVEFTHHRFVGDPGSAHPGAKLASVPAAVSWADTLLTKDPSSGDALATSSEGVLQFFAPDGVTEVEVKLFIAKVTGQAGTDLATLYGAGPLVFRVKILPEDPPAGDQPVGQRIRLQNLGYDTGSQSDDVDATDPDDPTRTALERFEEDQHLIGNEHVDTDTKTRLEQMFGR